MVCPCCGRNRAVVCPGQLCFWIISLGFLSPVSFEGLGGLKKNNRELRFCFFFLVMWGFWAFLFPTSTLVISTCPSLLMPSCPTPDAWKGACCQRVWGQSLPGNLAGWLGKSFDSLGTDIFTYEVKIVSTVLPIIWRCYGDQIKCVN